MLTTLILDSTLLFLEWSPFDNVPDGAEVFEHVTINDFEEEWTADSVTLRATVELATDLTVGLFGFDVGFGDPVAETTTATLTVTLESRPVLTVIGGLLMGAQLATTDEDRVRVEDRRGVRATSAPEVRP